MVIPLRKQIESANSPGRQPAEDWSHEDIARLRSGLKRGESLADLAVSLARTPTEIAARICEFRPRRIAAWRETRPAPRAGDRAR